MSERSVDIVYCDDIRVEKSEQFSIIGAYQFALHVPEFPFVIPKLCFWVRVRTSRDDPFKSLTFVVSDELGATLACLELPPEDLLAQEAMMKSFNWNGLDVEDQRIELGIQFGISPLVCDGPKTLKPRVVTERETLRCTAFKIEAGSPAA